MTTPLIDRADLLGLVAELASPNPNNTARLGQFIQLVQEQNRLLRSILAATIEPPRFSQGPSVQFRVVQVPLVDDVRQGPQVAVPPGYNVVVRQRHHSSTRTGYVASDEPSLANTLTRSELWNNDSIAVAVTNMSDLWFSADTANTYFELITEYAKQ